MKHAKDNGVKISVDVADKGVIARNHEFIMSLLKNYVDVFYANEEESYALFGMEPEKAIHKMSELAPTACLKVGKNGSLIISEGKLHNIPGYPAKPVDTTGAGDMYAAGFLYGITHGYDIYTAGKIASFSAARIVEVFGARPKFSLSAMIREHKII